jgi:hypothetical protein
MMDSNVTQDQLAVAVKVVELLKSRDPAVTARLSDDVVCQNLGHELHGRQKVLKHLLGDMMGRLYREAEWQSPRAHGRAALIVARTPAGSRLNGKVLLLHFYNDQVIKIQEQLLLPMVPPAETPVNIGGGLREMVNSALAARNPMLLCYVDEDGQPAVSFRGSVHVFTDNQLALWVRNSNGRFIRAIGANPRVALMYRNEETRATLQFQGRAGIADGADDRRRIFDALPKVERDHDFAELGMAVVIEIDRIEGYAGVADGDVVGAVNMRRAGTDGEGSKPFAPFEQHA